MGWLSRVGVDAQGRFVCQEDLHGTTIGDFSGFVEIGLRERLTVRSLRRLSVLLVIRCRQAKVPGTANEAARDNFLHIGL